MRICYALFTAALVAPVAADVYFKEQFNDDVSLSWFDLLGWSLFLLCWPRGNWILRRIGVDMASCITMSIEGLMAPYLSHNIQDMRMFGEDDCIYPYKMTIISFFSSSHCFFYTHPHRHGKTDGPSHPTGNLNLN